MKLKLIVSIITILYSTTTYANNISFEEHINNLKTEISAKGYDASILDKVFENNFVADKKISHSIKNQPEFKFPFDKYVGSKLESWRVTQGQKHFKDHAKSLKEIENKYKVNASVVVALWGLETNYGTYPLKNNAFKALANMSYSHSKEHRREYFKKELLSLFKIQKENDFDPLDMDSSWAGALGQCQFMPSNVLNYAVDWDKDGKVDIWHTLDDVFASSANFVNILGWVYNTSNVLEVELPKNVNTSDSAFHSVAVWKSMGVKFKNNNISSHDKLKLFTPKNKEGKIFLVSKNFDVIKKWNNSNYFAFSVLKLADLINNQ